MLYPVTGRLLALYRRIEADDGEVVNADELDAVEWQQNDTVENSIAFIRQCEMEAESLQKRADELAARADARAAAAQRERERLKLHLIATGQTRIDTAAGDRVCVQRNGGKPPIVLAEVIDPETVPGSCWRVRRDIDKDAVRVLLEAGEPLPFAKLGEPGVHLRIR